MKLKVLSLIAASLFSLAVGPMERHHHRCDNGERSNCGQNGDQDGKDNCHSFCNNVIIIPNPMPGGKGA